MYLVVMRAIHTRCLCETLVCYFW